MERRPTETKREDDGTHTIEEKNTNPGLPHTRKKKKSSHKLTNDVFKVNIAPTKQHTTDQDELENSSETFFSK
jgi:hypothetical protein